MADERLSPLQPSIPQKPQERQVDEMLRIRNCTPDPVKERVRDLVEAFPILQHIVNAIDGFPTSEEQKLYRQRRNQ